ncbi:methyltransferase domain-containing protein [Phaeodactylibacter luteus]|uniref:Methyltransferase domain-containing protein n=1 Tax=Phaeodactylibacter luteus TaxID=1564516 RepID=A0A5C6S4L0_9BACT|nr:methyltransferase domain-containing protein [Phaeodactylibacter luteus]TXB69426.1 methyltransferase domain-containing protein [Phaeodactylibacter luteus]
METELNAAYWENRYRNGDTPWDIGYPSPALVDYFSREVPISSRILIPGAGFGHEARWLGEQGYSSVYICDWSAEALQPLKATGLFPDEHLIAGDFFELSGQYDFIIEQTFFCALPPAKRAAYAAQCHRLLKPGGRLAGLLFNTVFPFDGPPFGGHRETYEALLQPLFHKVALSPCSGSIAPRAGRELFLEAQKQLPAI